MGRVILRSWADVAQDIRSEDARTTKNAVQEACDRIEYGRTPSGQDATRLKRALSTQLGSSNTAILRWVYKLIALIGEPEYETYLVRQLRDVDFDAENRSWAVCALAVVAPNFLVALGQVDEDFTTAYALSSQMFMNQVVSADDLKRAYEDDAPLTQQWLSLLHGSHRITIPEPIHRDLILSEVPEIAEYSLWSLRSRFDYKPSLLGIYPGDIRRHPENVRRWYYQAFCALSANLDTFESQVVEWVRIETESRPREGLARGLVRYRDRRPWSGVLEDWRRSETDPFVQRALSSLNVVPVAPPSDGSYPRSPATTIDLASPRERTNVDWGGLRNVFQVTIDMRSTEVKKDNSININKMKGDIGTLQGAKSVQHNSSFEQARADPDAFRTVSEALAELRAAFEQRQSPEAEHVLVQVDAAISEAAERRPTVWERLPKVTDAVKAIGGLGGVAIRAVETLQSFLPPN